MSLEEMTRQAASDGQVLVEPGWGQGRATFGGLIAALLIARMRAEAGSGAPLRTVTTFLMAPVVPGPATVTARILRQGSSVTLVEAELEQNGELLASAQGAFGVSRSSRIVLPPGGQTTRPTFAPHEGLTEVEHQPGLTPDFYQHVILKPASGYLPFTGAAAPDFGGWMRYRDAPTRMHVEHFVGLIDAWPPAMTPMLQGPAPVSTISWSVELFAEAFPAEAFWQYSVRTDACVHGYGHSGAKVWDAQGNLAAISRQTIAVFG